MPYERNTTRNIAMTIILIIALYMVSIFFYHKFEGWEYLDAAYFITASITTIGYGDFVPKTDEGKLFTIFLAFTGISLAFILITTIASYREKTIDKHIEDKFSLLKKLSILQRPVEKEKKRNKEREKAFTKIPKAE